GHINRPYRRPHTITRQYGSENSCITDGNHRRNPFLMDIDRLRFGVSPAAVVVHVKLCQAILF
ncbi:hypothetical protein, partial [Gluconacetobacter entanii]|uniref:hypothetical protein n=1 Tax=Gluconacetobacter entanii TaxID=108528 RepID=UPI001ABF3730